MIKYKIVLGSAFPGKEHNMGKDLKAGSWEKDSRRKNGLSGMSFSQNGVKNGVKMA